MTTQEYRVSLDMFGGPMDLLLYLVRRNEVEILELPLARVTAQFLEFLAVLEFLDVDLASEFVATASALLEIKSRSVLPRQEQPEEEQPLDEEPRSDLVLKLLEYKKLRDASQALEEQAALWQERYPRLADERPSQDRDPSSDQIKEVELWDLVSALARILRRGAVEEETRLRNDDTPISVYMGTISERVLREGRVAFSSLFDGAMKRSVVVGMFLAILELLRHNGFRATQPVDYGEIWILPPLDGAPQTAAPGAGPSNAGVVDQGRRD
jgi:segregation and condensation protein A